MALKVNLVSADDEVWSGEASLVVAKTVIGEIGIMAGHEPVLGVLAAGEVRITPRTAPRSSRTPRTASCRWRATTSRSSQATQP